MAAPLYFLPKMTRALLCPHGKLSRSVLASRGLGQVWADVDLDDLCVNEIAVSGGPGGTHGLLLSALPVATREPPRRLQYDAKDTHVRWASALGGELWIGIDDLSPVEPADLVRKKPLRGHWIELADGQAWEVPILRHPLEGSTELPRDFTYDDAGQLQVTIKERYRQLWEDSAATALFYFGGDSDEIEFTIVLRRILDALALNYRLGPVEQTALRLIDSTNWQEALGATVDLPKVREIMAEQQKKTEAAADAATAAQPSPSSTPGSTAA